MRTCKTKCMNFKTKTGYLCNTLESPTMYTRGKSWCKIKDNEYNIGKLSLPTPPKTNDYY